MGDRNIFRKFINYREKIAKNIFWSTDAHHLRKFMIDVQNTIHCTSAPSSLHGSKFE